MRFSHELYRGIREEVQGADFGHDLGIRKCDSFRWWDPSISRNGRRTGCSNGCSQYHQTGPGKVYVPVAYFLPFFIKIVEGICISSERPPSKSIENILVKVGFRFNRPSDCIHRIGFGFITAFSARFCLGTNVLFRSSFPVLSEVGWNRVDDTIAILRGIKDKYELWHGVRITDSAVVSAAKLAKRYLTERKLPGLVARFEQSFGVFILAQILPSIWWMRRPADYGWRRRASLKSWLVWNERLWRFGSN